MKNKAIVLSSILLLSSCNQPLKPPTEKPLYLFLGSSVTYGSACGGVSFVDILPDAINCEVIKFAISGTTLTDIGLEDDGNYIYRLENDFDKNAKPEHLIVQLSTNDVTKLRKVGELSESKELDSFDKSTVIGAIEYIVAYAKQTWNCDVSFYTNPKYNNALYEEVINRLYLVQEKWNIGIIDFYNYVDMEPLSEDTLSSYMADAIHPNAQGYTWMRDVLANYLKIIYENKYPGYNI